MLGAKRQHTITRAAVIAALVYGAGLLSACATTPNAPVGKKAPTPYKHSLYVGGDNGLASLFEANLATTTLANSVIVTPTPQPAALQAILRLKTYEDKAATATHPPAQPGKLSRQLITPRHVLTYQLIASTGNVIDTGEITQTGATTPVYLPRLDNLAIIPTGQTLQSLLTNTANRLQPLIASQKWQTQVISQTMPYHVTIPAGKAAGITYGDFFITQNTPTSILQVVTLDTTPEGQSRATLRLIQGPLPDIGRILLFKNKAPTIKK